MFHAPVVISKPLTFFLGFEINNNATALGQRQPKRREFITRVQLCEFSFHFCFFSSQTINLTTIKKGTYYLHPSRSLSLNLAL